MFRLSLEGDGEEFSAVYDQSRLIAGLAGSKVSLPLKGAQVRSQHFALYAKNGRYRIENLAFDPHLRVNDSPFHTKTLKNGDLITLAGYQICFEELSKPEQEEEEEKLQTKSHTIDEIDNPQEINTLDKSPLNKRKFSDHIKETGLSIVEKLKVEQGESKWHVLALFTGIAIFLCTLFGTIFYVSVNDRSELQRMVAARGLSDIAMTLSYAKMHNIKPDNLNWLDPKFLIETSKNVFPDEISKRRWIDEKGSFTQTPYILRIYSDPQLDRFLLIAQPKAGFIQWLIPNNIIAVDSKEMIMKEISNLRELNRLIANALTFQGKDQEEIVNLVHQQKSLPLSSLAQNKEGLGFLPPDELVMINPELQYYIYNAPRYFLWNQTLVDKAIEFGLNKNGDKEAILRSLEKRKPFKEMVLYTSRPIETAIDARRALQEHFEQYSIHIGHVSLDENNKIASSHVLMKSHKAWANDLNANALPEGIPLPQLPTEIAQVTKNPFHPFMMFSSESLAVRAKKENQTLHPLVIELNLALEERENHLKPKLEPLLQLLGEHAKRSDRQFFIHYRTLYSQFEAVLRAEQAILDKTIEGLHEKYVMKKKTVTLPQFLSFLDQKGIDMGYEEDSFVKNLGSAEEQLEKLFEMIEGAQEIHLLDHAVADAKDLIRSDHFKNQEAATKFRNRLRSIVLYKLETMLWQPQGSNQPLPSEEELRWIVNRILKNGYINQKEAKEFYLSHFLES